MIRRPPRSTLFPYTTALPISRERPRERGTARRRLDRGGMHLACRRRDQHVVELLEAVAAREGLAEGRLRVGDAAPDRKSTRLNSSHSQNSYAVFCLTKQKQRR